jgi:asparagine synthase (glutamine-hydrolysing)
MEGIAGIIGPDQEKKASFLLDKMVRPMLLEEFYASDTIYDENFGLAAGWVFMKDSGEAPMPIWNESKEIFILLAGQIFFQPETVEWLEKRGHAFTKEGYNYLVHLYEEKGKAFVEEINGQFAGLLVDRKENIICIFNDRYGFGRIYYRKVGDQLFFSTEAKSLLKLFPDTRELDPVALSELLTCGCTLRNHCLFRNVSILSPGNLWIFERNSNNKKSRYLSEGPVREDESIDKEGYYQRIKLTFKKTLPRYFEPNRTLGMSLTGGKDTRIILAFADSFKPDLKCYTFGSIYGQNRDEEIGEIIARSCGLSFSVIKVGSEFFRLFPTLAKKAVYISDGLMDVSGAAGLYANKIAREISPIRITGNYGQEIFEGYVAFKPNSIAERYANQDFKPFLKTARDSYQEEKANCDKFTFILSKQFPWHHYARYKLERSQMIIRSPFIDNDLVNTVTNAPLAIRQASQDVRARLFQEGDSFLANTETDMGYKYGDFSWNRKLSMLFQEFMAKAEYAYDYGMPGWLSLLDYMVKPFHLEKMFLGRHKYYHFRVWYRDIFADFIKEILLDQKTLTRDFINKTAVEKIVLEHTKGIINHTLEIDQLLTLELIYRFLIEEA